MEEVNKALFCSNNTNSLRSTSAPTNTVSLLISTPPIVKYKQTYKIVYVNITYTTKYHIIYNISMSMSILVRF